MQFEQFLLIAFLELKWDIIVFDLVNLPVFSESGRILNKF